jgi:hypothetical protein
MQSRRQVFALAGMLTATALTGGVAAAGLTHHPAHRATVPAKVQVVPPTVAPAIAIGRELEGVD